MWIQSNMVIRTNTRHRAKLALAAPATLLAMASPAFASTGSSAGARGAST